MFQVNRIAVAFVLSGFLWASASTATGIGDLWMTCKPRYGEMAVRGGALVSTETPWYLTYHLFDNPDLFFYRVTLTNGAPEALRIRSFAEVGPVDLLDIRLSRDGDLLSSTDYRIQWVELRLRTPEYLKQGHVLPDVKHQRAVAHWGSRPQELYESLRYQEKTLFEVPERLLPQQELRLTFQITGREGVELPLGDYLIRVTDRHSGGTCLGDQLIVLRAPETDLDIAEDHLIRHRFHLDHGDDNAARHELELATRRAPESLKAWLELGSLAFRSGDLEVQAEASERLRALLADRPQSERRLEFRGDVEAAFELVQKAVALSEELKP